MIKILFLDTSALLSFFISDKGTQTMRWLLSSDNRAHHATRYVINNQVIREFEDSLRILVSKNDIKQATAESILTLFNTHYKNKKFKVVGRDASVKDTMDGMYNFLGCLLRPVLVSSNADQEKHNNEYIIINPQTRTPAEIQLELKGKKSQQEKDTKKYLYQDFFKRTRMKLAL